MTIRTHPLRVAVLLPATDTAVELELPPRLAGRASLHVARMALDSVTVEGLRQMEADAKRQARVLARVKPDLAVFACTSGTFVFGAARELHLVGELSDIFGVPVITAARSVLGALSRRGAQRIRLGAPYLPEIVRAEVDYLQAAGFAVVSQAALSITDDEQTAALGLNDLAGLIGERADGADTVVLSCTNLRTLDGLEQLSTAAGVPVVSSNSALFEEIGLVLEQIRSGQPGRRVPSPDAGVVGPLQTSTARSGAAPD